MVGAGGALFCLLLAVVGAAMTWVTVDAAVNSGITNPEAKGFQIRLGGLGTAVKRDDSGVAIGESLKLGADRPIGVMLIAISLVACIGTVVWGLGFGPLEAQLSGPLRERIGIAIAGVALVLVVLYVAWIGKAVAMSRAMHDAQHTADGFHSWTTAPGIGLYLGAGGALVALVIVSAVVRRISEGGLWLRLGELGGLLVGGLLVVVVVTPWDGSVLWSQLSLWEAASGDIESPAVTKKRLAKLRADLGDYRSNKGRFSDPEEKAKFLEELNRTRDEYRAMAGPDARPLFVSR
jgi:hypothetical protein